MFLIIIFYLKYRICAILSAPFEAVVYASFDQEIEIEGDRVEINSIGIAVIRSIGIPKPNAKNVHAWNYVIGLKFSSL